MRQLVLRAMKKQIGINWGSELCVLQWRASIGWLVSRKIPVDTLLSYLLEVRNARGYALTRSVFLHDLATRRPPILIRKQPGPMAKLMAKKNATGVNALEVKERLSEKADEGADEEVEQISLCCFFCLYCTHAWS